MHPVFQIMKMRINLFQRLAGLFLFLCLTAQAKADKTIYVLADIHVMSPSLLDSSDNIAWQKDLAEHRKMQDLSAAVFNQLIEQIIAEHPDVLLICGDLTKDGEAASHEYVLERLRKVEAAGIPVFVIPGNHDYGTQEEARKYANNTYTSVESYTYAQFREAYKDFGYGGDSEVHDASLSYATEIFPGLTLIGIDSGNMAHAKKTTISWCSQKAAEARDQGNQVIAMVHHSLIPHFYEQNSFMVLSVIDNHDILRDSLISAGVKVVLTGHYHISDNTRFMDNAGREIYDICTGSPLSYPCDYRKLVFDDQFKQLKILTESITTLDGYDDFPNYAKGRLEDAFLRWAYHWFENHQVNEQVTEIMSQSVAEAFIIHAEGNEPANPATEEALVLYDEILAMAPFFEGDASKITEVCLSIKSMLGDYPSEDEPDNVVDDRQLTITMYGEPAGIQNIQATDAHKDSWYTLQGQRLNGRPTKPGLYIRNGRIIIVH